MTVNQTLLPRTTPCYIQATSNILSNEWRRLEEGKMNIEMNR